MVVKGLRRATVSIQPRQQVQRDEDRREEEDQEDGGPYHRSRLLGAQQHRHPGPEEGRRDVDEDGEPDQAEEVEAAAYGHAGRRALCTVTSVPVMVARTSEAMV